MTSVIAYGIAFCRKECAVKMHRFRTPMPDGSHPKNQANTSPEA